MVRTRSQRLEKETAKGPEDHQTRARATRGAGTQKMPSTTRSGSQPADSQASTSATQSNQTGAPEQWVSRVRQPNRTINKTAALAAYKLKPSDLEGIPFTKTQTVVRGFTRPMYLYKERDIERKAWEVHGGPEGLQGRIDFLRNEHSRKNLKGDFQAPHGYSAQSAVGPSITISRLSPAEPGAEVAIDTYEPYLSSSSVLQNIKKQMDPWLWRQCLTAINTFHFSREFDERVPTKRDREEAMEAAFRQLPQNYPPRPAQPLPSSPAVDALRAVLQEAPKDPPPHDRERSHEDLDKTSNTDPRTSDVWPWTYEWSKEYLERVFHALQDVIDAHGMGAEGWATARWEVYDTYKETMTEGITCNFYSSKKSWHDQAAKWLREDTLEEGLRAYCEDSEDSAVSESDESQTSLKGKSVAR